MGKKNNILTPRLDRTLTTVGSQIKLARLRRNLSTSLIAERANITRPTLCKIEQGAPTVSIGAYARVLLAIGGLDQDLLLVAKDDIVGRTLQELNLKIAKRSR